uniref:Protein MNN4-like n=1 Tax=Cucumis melo TaxID=3656 RepID=A0A9I9DY66_CUCME
MTFDEHCEEFEKKIENFSPLKEEVSRPKKKRNVMMKKALRAQLKKRRVGKAKKKPQEDEGEDGEESE